MAATTDKTARHADTTRLPIHEIVRQLNDSLGPTLVAGLAGSRNSKIGYRWAREDGPVPRDEAQRRLHLAHRAWIVVSGSEGANVARMWFIGANPSLGEISPIEAIAHDRAKDVIEAAYAMADDRHAA